MSTSKQFIKVSMMLQFIIGTLPVGKHRIQAQKGSHSSMLSTDFSLKICETLSLIIFLDFVRGVSSTISTVS